MTAKAKTTKKAAETQYVTEEKFNDRFNRLESALERVLDVVEASSKSVPETPLELTPQQKAVAQAVPNKYTTNPDWEDAAREILGQALDHTEVEHEKTGGIKFTVVIKNEHSNASKEYLERNKVDRRTKEVGALGMDGVTEWCNLIKQNLSKK